VIIAVALATLKAYDHQAIAVVVGNSQLRLQ
jgi:hypothetical protein